MEYTVNQLAKLAGITPRTLRWYDRMGLLKPARTTASGYRLYGPEEVDRLQQILFYRELEVPLEDVKAILDDPEFDRQAALQSHLEALKERRERLERLLETVEKTLLDKKGECTMTDKEKFAAFQKQAIEENERKYGKEIREKYGDKAVDASNQAILGMDREKKEAWDALDREIRAALAAAVKVGEDPAGEEGQRIAALHKKWLGFVFQDYDPARHAGIAQLYVADERFTAYYDGEVAGCARFLRDAVIAYTREK